MSALVPTPTDVATADFRAISWDGAEILVRWFTRSGDEENDPAGTGAAVLFLHGGSMILGSVDLYDAIIRRYVSASGVPALAVDYRLAPQHPHPTPVEDCFAGLSWLAAHTAELGVDPSRIAIMGDSAGGALAAGVALMARDRQGPSIARLMLLYPMLDDRPLAPEADLEPIVTFTYADNETGWMALLGEAAGTDGVSPYAAPARAADVQDLPPLYLDVGQADILCAQDMDFARRFGDSGITVEMHVHPGANHAFELLAPDADVSRRAMADRIRVLRSV